MILNLELEPSDIVQIDALLDAVFEGRRLVEIDSFLGEARLYAHELPRRVRQAVYGFQLLESHIALCIRNSPLRLAEIGPTPTAIPPYAISRALTRQEALHILYSSLLGEPFTWSSIQNGNIINEIIPIHADAGRPISSGSANRFDLHTEDAFHECAGDYLGLMCLRNPTATPTLIAPIPAGLGEGALDILREPRFVIGANVAHEVDRKPKRMPILFGHPDAPYMRINLNVDPQLINDPPAQAAYDSFGQALQACAEPVVLHPGDCFYLDNYRAAHGRPPYAPAFEGGDRWLKRVYVTGYLRRSRAERGAPEARLIQTGARARADV